MAHDRNAKMLQSRLVLIAGNEDVLRREALSDLIQAAGVQPDDFDLETFSGDASSPADWVASVGTSPFLGERRVAVVRHLLRCDVERLKGVPLGKLPQTSLLILVADEESGGEDRERKLATLRTAWQRAVEAAGGSIARCDTDPKNLRPAIKQRAEAMGKQLTSGALELLVEMTGESLSRALDELEKLELFIGDQAQIREADVRRVVAPSREWNVYKMVDGIFSGDVGAALKQLRSLVGSADKAEAAAFSRILPQVSRRLRQLWQGRICVEANCGPGNAPDSVRALFPERPNLAGESPYAQNLAMNAARRISFERLNRCFAILADTDARLKGALDAFSGIEALERMILEMAQS